MIEQITTAAELDALPVGSIFQSVEFDWQLATKNRFGEWIVTMSDEERSSVDLARWLLPAIVVRRGPVLTIAAEQVGILEGHLLGEAMGGYIDCSCGWPTKEQYQDGEHPALHLFLAAFPDVKIEGE